MELKVEDRNKNIETLQIVFSEQEVSDAEENVVRKLANRTACLSGTEKYFR